MIRTLRSDLPSFKEVTFRAGLNLIVVESEPDSTLGHTRNSAGKSSIVELIHFLLGADARTGTLCRHEALQQVMFGLSLDVCGQTVTVERSGANASKVFLAAGSEEPLPVALSALVTLASVGQPGRASRHYLSEAQLAGWRRTGYLGLAEGRRVKISLLDEAENQDIVGAASRVHAPVLIIHGSADDVVPVQDAYDLYEAIPHERKSLIILKGADHRVSDPEQMEETLARIRDWLLRHGLGEAPAAPRT